MGNINEWQHSAMYVAFLLSGVVDLVGFYMPPGTLPVGTEQARFALLNPSHTLLAWERCCRPAQQGTGEAEDALAVLHLMDCTTSKCIASPVLDRGWGSSQFVTPEDCWGLQACLSLAFVVEGTLFAFHLEGALLNVHAHLLLVLCIFAAAATLLLEMQFPGNVLLGVARAQLVMLQGVWFTEIARLLFEGAAHSCRGCTFYSA